MHIFSSLVKETQLQNGLQLFSQESAYILNLLLGASRPSQSTKMPGHDSSWPNGRDLIGRCSHDIISDG